MSFQEESKSLFRLIDSYQTENIEIALAILKTDKVLRTACGRRYNPLLEKIDKNLSQSFLLLHKVLPKIDKDHNFARDFVLYYAQLGALKSVQHVLERGGNSSYMMFSHIKNSCLLNQLLALEAQGMPKMQLRTIELLKDEKPEPLVIKADLKRFEYLLNLEICSQQQFEAFLPYIPNMPYLNSLKISNANLTELPPSFEKLAVGLKKLSLPNNQLKNLPEWLSKFQEIEELDLSNNHFELVPSVLKELPALERLYLPNNQLKEIAVVDEIFGLDVLHLDNNPFFTVPLAILNCQQLVILGLRNCALKELPIGIGRLKKMRYLYLSENQITAIPASIAQLKKLETLNLNNNPITCEGIPIEIQECKKLSYLYLRSSNVKESDFRCEEMVRWLTSDRHCYIFV